MALLNIILPPIDCVRLYATRYCQHSIYHSPAVSGGPVSTKEATPGPRGGSASIQSEPPAS